MEETYEEFTARLAAMMKVGVFFDWHLAAELISSYNRMYSKHNKIGLPIAYAHLPPDGKCILIWKDGQPVPLQPFSCIGHSCYELWIGEGDSHADDLPIYNCFCPLSDHPDWTADTYWPESALEILRKVAK